ncbi:MAG: phospholipid/cholesterol/gamma-HCH transport system substrate-binding protein, partial [Mycobacterium sp.]|nr:phospholipid/cholesterol/gamma-HCH transport system substrate-binding protein [Mycobacterium sp.]
MTANKRIRRALRALVVTITVGAAAGCDWQGVNSLPLPGTQGHGPGSYTIQAQLPDVANIQQNSRV